MASQENTEPLSSDNLSRVSIQSVQLVPALSQRYLAYALSTIMSRSLPDVRDGLKPVHRRLIYAMKQLQLQPETNPKKSARVVGDVIGKYHPHGDTAIYEAMVRLAQDFAQRYPLVDGQGNFGNIDGDNPAAMRYTEVRLTEVAMLMLEGIDEDAVDFRFTYDNEGQEPIVLPAAFPNLLANGSQGIAVGMATNIPPHNVAEICDALILLIKNPQTTNAEVLKIIQGPDFPTGGVLLETKENLNRIYEQGKGSVRLRAQWQTEKLKSGQWQAVVTEIPYQIHKSKLIEQIAEQIDHKKLPLLDTVRDESTTDIRIVLEPKSRNTEPDILMEHLFRQTDLEIKYSLNMNLLNAENVPGIMSLQEILQAYLTHRQQVLTRCSQFRLSAVNNRLHIVDGLLRVYLNLDELIRLIREEDHPHQAIMKKWHLTDVQAESILNMRLRSLRKLEQFEMEQEFQKLTEEKNKLNILLKDASLQWDYIGQEIAGLKKRFNKNTPLGKRRTQISNPSHRSEKLEAIDISLPSEPMTIFYSAKGWIRSYKGSYLNSDDIKHKEGDEAYLSIAAGSNDQLLLFSDQGRAYALDAKDLPGGRGFGEPLRLMIDLPQDQNIIAMAAYRPDSKILLVSQQAKAFIIQQSDALAQTKNGKQIFQPQADDRLKFVQPLNPADIGLALLSSQNKLLIISTEAVPQMAKGQGVILQKYLHGAYLKQIYLFNRQQGLPCSIRQKSQVLSDLGKWIGKRGYAGAPVDQDFHLGHVLAATTKI